MILLAVNFHYIHQDGIFPYEGIYPTTPEIFRKQIEELGRHFSFLSSWDLLQNLTDSSNMPERGAVITFDDGLASQYEQALPILDELGVPAVFFVSASPLKEGKALQVHKIHYVRANTAPKELLSELHRFLMNEGLPAGISEADMLAAKATYRYDTPESALIKYQLNFKLWPEVRDRFVNHMFSLLIPDEKSWCNDTYMTLPAIKDIAQRGYLGSHTYSHLPLATLTADKLEYEIIANQQALEELCSISPEIISYPYGSESAVSPLVKECASRAGYKAGFTMERALNRSLHDPLLLARVDTNDALGGKRPLIAICSNELTCLQQMRSCRARYIDEAAILRLG